MSYYGLYIPANTGHDQSVDSPYVFREKHEALKVLRQYKDGRVREFSNTDDAAKYAETGSEVTQSKYSDVKTSTANVEKLPFRVPSKHDLTEFKKIIESGDKERVKSIIWENPRYLVSSGDTPTTLKEGYRYNAMHICAISNKAQIAEVILQTVSDFNFVELLSGKKNGKASKELCVIMLDYYLNMPEKGRCETPLHLAVKNGAIEMVEVLTSYPECKMSLNSENLLPKDIICARMSDASHELRRKIQVLLEERFYVPVIRSLDDVIPPTVGQPFSTNHPPNLSCDPLSPEVKIQALAGPMNKEQAKKFCRRWKTPPRHGHNTTTPIVYSPFISPVKITPHKSRNITLNRKSLFCPTVSPLDLSYSSYPNGDQHQHNGMDSENGNYKTSTDTETSVTSIDVVETNNNNHLSNNNKTINMLKSALFPKTPLFNKNKNLFFTYRDHNAASPIVMDMNVSSPSSIYNTVSPNTSICEHDYFDTPGYKERHLKITDTEKGLEIIGRQLAKEQNIEWKEFWDFLGVLIDIASQDGLQKFEDFLAQRTKEKENMKNKLMAKNNGEVASLDDICSALGRMGLCKEAANNINDNRGAYAARGSVTAQSSNNVNYPQSTTPYTCVEKSLQVFAKRMTKTILHNIENIISINDAFVSELKRLKSLICSFKEDSRFLNVNFAKVHSRFANLIANYLDKSQDIDETAKTKIQKSLQQITLSPGDRKEQLQCVCKLILVFMENDGDQILPENLKTEAMCSKAWLMESECECQWENGLSRKSSRRMRMEARNESRIELDHNSALDGVTSTTKQSVQEQSKPPDIIVNINEWRQRSNGSMSSSSVSSLNTEFHNDEEDEEVFWSDFCSDSDDDEDDIFVTPPDSPSMLSLSDSDGDNIFIYGNEPTKRDLDVLNAIFHIEIKKEIYPHIHAWKSAVLRYSNDDMDFFPSPSIVKGTPTRSKSFTLGAEKSRIAADERLLTAKRLFGSPSRLPSSSTPTRNRARDHHVFHRDHFSSDSSPVSPPLSGIRTDSIGGLSNLSLMNISSSE